ncbi:methylenetetrahydrofolate reductase (NADPH) [Mesorhizobium sp. J18]|uniref:methylenetetrahydrofolate reductase n=1 Tax=Mesorhizobium sp. J18 TaxID=935263 RepID=UPI0011993846|nr:methylenetetrahydrofolate reductase [Mesorhizobium sp. J18]TWG93504.1 methylenetetrahydrofolate reductase (NADPH) [Mesorhizobium sp. J18]
MAPQSVHGYAADQQAVSNGEASLAQLLAGYSVEVTARDVDSVLGRLRRGSEVFIANLPNDSPDVLVRAAARVGAAGLIPVPHIVARKIRDEPELDGLLARLAGEAGVERALVLGGDRDRPAGDFDAALQLLHTRAFERHNFSRIAFACYPEGHPHIDKEVLRQALREKLAEATSRGLDTLLVSQFTFEPEPILKLARDLRASGITAPLRIGVAGSARRTTLVKYAIRCGVGASLRALTERGHLVSGLIGGETPGELLEGIAPAAATEPALGIEGVHFFTFGEPGRSIEWAEAQINRS